jgi:hypothetical protein
MVSIGAIGSWTLVDHFEARWSIAAVSGDRIGVQIGGFTDIPNRLAGGQMRAQRCFIVHMKLVSHEGEALPAPPTSVNWPSESLGRPATAG